MSALGKKRTFRYSFDERISALLHAERNVKTKRLCGFKVDDQIELGWCLHGKVGRLRTLENAVDIRRGLRKLFAEIVGISDETPSLGEFAPIIHRRYAITSSQQSDVFAICRVEGIGHHNETAALIARLRGDNAFDLIFGMNRCCIHLNASG